MDIKSVMEIERKDWDRFQELLQLSTMLQEVCQEGEKAYKGFRHIVSDVWFAFYAVLPVLSQGSEHSYPVQYKILSQMMHSDSYKRWHRLTAGDELLSVITATAFSESLKEFMRQNSRLQGAQQQMFKAEKEIDAISKELQILRKKKSSLNANGAEEEKRYLQQKKQIALNRLNDKQRLIQEAKTNIKLEIDEHLTDRVENMLENSKDKAKLIKKSLLSLNMQGGNRLDHVPISAQMELANRLQENKQLQKIAELTGRFKRIARNKQRQKEKITMARKEVTLGQEVARLLPIEQANLLLPHYKLDFLRRFSEQQTLIFDKKGKDRRGRGPMIICIDESSSMTTLKAQSKAFCLALLSIAHKQKRDLAIIPFASDLGEIRQFHKGRATTDEILTFSDSFLGGGTNYEKPLLASLDILSQSKFNLADVLFVTDGTSFLSSQFIQEFNAIKKKRKFTCTAIVLTNLFNAVDVTLVHRFSDRVIEANDLFEAEDAFTLT